MSTEPHQLSIGGLQVTIVRKRIKNLHLGVYPPNGRVRIAVPLRVSDDAVRLAVIGKLGWIRRKRAGFAAQDRQGPRAVVSGETHYVLGRRYRMQVLEGAKRASVTLGRSTIRVAISRDASTGYRERLMRAWYRQRLREVLSGLQARWEPQLGRADFVGIKRMRTRWGSCNPRTRRIWLNLELAKKSPACMEYVLVHELAHLIERGHGPKFIQVLDENLPRWRALRDELNAAPLSHEDWQY